MNLPNAVPLTVVEHAVVLSDLPQAVVVNEPTAVGTNNNFSRYAPPKTLPTAVAVPVYESAGSSPLQTTNNNASRLNQRNNQNSITSLTSSYPSQSPPQQQQQLIYRRPTLSPSPPPQHQPIQHQQHLQQLTPHYRQQYGAMTGDDLLWQMKQQRKRSTFQSGLWGGLFGLIILGPVGAIAVGAGAAIVTKSSMKRREKQVKQQLAGHLHEPLSASTSHQQHQCFGIVPHRNGRQGNRRRRGSRR